MQNEPEQTLEYQDWKASGIVTQAAYVIKFRASGNPENRMAPW
jgi:hypothetical protein